MINWNNIIYKKKKYHPLDKRIIKAFNDIRAKDKRQYLCHAPFKSLTFFHTGDVLACWYNKLFPLGKFPDDTIEEIWFSKRSQRLRDFISHNDLSYGCTDCRLNFSNMNFYAVGPWRYDFLPEQTSKYPVSIDFQISNKCNLQCIMCNGEYSANVRTNRENQNSYENPYDENFFRQIESFIPHLKEASFSGGEPFFAPEFFRVWDLIKTINPKINLSVTTNGNILNDKIRSYLNALPFNISVSLDAITEETYRKIRVNGNLNAVLSNMEYFAEYAKNKGMTFAVKICPMRQNWHELPELAMYLSKRDISFLFNTVFYPPYCALWNLSSVRLKEIAMSLGNSQLTGESFNQKLNITRYNDFIRQIEIWRVDAVKREQLVLEMKTSRQLADIFILKVQDYLKDELNNLDDECPVRIEDMRQLVNDLIKDSPSEKEAIAGMLYYATAPVDRWLSEILIRDYEKNRDRFLQIGMMTED